MKQIGSTRRRVLQLGAGSVLVGCGTWAAPLLAAAGVQVPSTPMILSRVVRRSLRDGAAIEVKREWKVEFARQSRGYAITGEQVSVTVDTPPALSALASVEKGRSTAAMFPILLSSEGLIMAAGPSTSAQSLTQAVDRANSLISQREASETDKTNYRRFVAELQQAGGTMLDQMPGDLFFPSTQPLREVRSVPLSEGMVGEFELGWEARVQADSQLLQYARREVITRVGKSERISAETWTLTSA